MKQLSPISIKLFYLKDKTKKNIYGIYFYINGHKKLVLIDDYVSYIGISFRWFPMSKSEENEILIELIKKHGHLHMVII